MTMLIAKSTNNKNMIALGDYALVGNVYTSIAHTHNKMWRNVIGEDVVAEFHQALKELPRKEVDWDKAYKHEKAEIRALTALNRKKLRELKDDPEFIVREMVVKSCYDCLKDEDSADIKSVYEAIIAEMFKTCFSEKEIMVACVIANKGTDEQVALLASHPSDAVRELVAKNTTDSEVLDRLSYDKSDFVRMEVAKNMETKRKTLYRLAADDNYVVRSYAVIS